MATKVHMEALSPTMEEGQVVKWHKAEGDPVSQGELLAEIETDKATMELVARGEGVLRKILRGEGRTAQVGEVIAVIAAEGEDISALIDAAGGNRGTPEGAAGPPSRVDKSKSYKELATKEDVVATRREVAAAPDAPAGRDEGGRLKASPLARRLAQEAGVELSRIRGTGPGGRIVKRDVEAEVERVPRPSGAPAYAGEEGPEYEDVRVSQMRKTIARRLAESLGPVPHFFLTIEIDMDRALEARSRINELLEDRGERVSVNDLVIRAVASALRQHPAVNASWQGDHIRRYRRVHVGVAVAIEDGLITPVIHDAHAKGVAEIARQVRELAARARERKLKPEEYTGATFSVSNLGMFGIREFTGVINPPEAAILAVGAMEEVPVVMNGQIVVRPRMKVTLSCDHRAVDGATGARFLKTLKAMLEEPAASLL